MKFLPTSWCFNREIHYFRWYYWVDCMCFFSPDSSMLIIISLFGKYGFICEHNVALITQSKIRQLATPLYSYLFELDVWKNINSWYLVVYTIHVRTIHKGRCYFTNDRYEHSRQTYGSIIYCAWLKYQYIDLYGVSKPWTTEYMYPDN